METLYIYGPAGLRDSSVRDPVVSSVCLLEREKERERELNQFRANVLCRVSRGPELAFVLQSLHVKRAPRITLSRNNYIKS